MTIQAKTKSKAKTKIKAKTKRTSRIKRKLTTKDWANIAAEAAEDKKALEIKIIEVKKLTSLADYLVICTGESAPQIRAISSNVEDKLREKGVKSIRWEGREASNWFILDAGSIIVHIFGKEERQRYKLEDLWGKRGITYHL